MLRWAVKLKVLGILQEAGLSANDPEVTELFRGSYRSREDFVLAGSKLAVKRGTSAGVPSPAAVVQPTGGETATSDQARLLQLYNEEKKSIKRGSEGILRLRDKYRKLGLESFE